PPTARRLTPGAWPCAPATQAFRGQRRSRTARQRGATATFSAEASPTQRRSDYVFEEGRQIGAPSRYAGLTSPMERRYLARAASTAPGSRNTPEPATR